MASETFWDFSVRTYRTPGVAGACLSLQNDYGADVNMVLFCAWLGGAVGPFDDELFRRANDFSTGWAANVVKHLRAARTWMKQTGCNSEPVPTDSCMELREDIKNVELAAEKMQQEVLESMLPAARTRNQKPDKLIENVVGNLRHYLAGLDIPFNEDVRDKLGVIIPAAFPDVDAKAIAEALTER